MKIVNVSYIVSTLPNVVTMSASAFLSLSTPNDIKYVVIDRSAVTSREIVSIKKHCQTIGLNPYIDKSYLDVSYVYIMDYSEHSENESLLGMNETEWNSFMVEMTNKAITEAVNTLKNAEEVRINYELGDLEKVINRINPMIGHPMVKRFFQLSKVKKSLVTI